MRKYGMNFVILILKYMKNKKDKIGISFQQYHNIVPYLIFSYSGNLYVNKQSGNG